MKEICSKYVIKIQKKLDDLFFLYGGQNLNLELKLNQISDQNKINILVYDKYSTVINTNNNFKISKHAICPECGDICLIKFEEHKIKLYDCKNNHIKYISLNDYEDTQKIYESKIICNICKKRKMNHIICKYSDSLPWRGQRVNLLISLIPFLYFPSLTD